MDRRLGGPRTGAMRVMQQLLFPHRSGNVLSRWRREAAGTIRRTLAAARAWLERSPSGRSRLRAIVLLVGLAATSRAAFAAGNSVTVSTLIDDDTKGDGKCSLREAIANINAQGDTTNGDCATGLGNDSIDFSVSGTITLTRGVLSIGGAEPSLTIEGGNTITLDGAGSNQIFDVNTLVSQRSDDQQRIRNQWWRRHRSWRAAGYRRLIRR